MTELWRRRQELERARDVEFAIYHALREAVAARLCSVELLDHQGVRVNRVQDALDAVRSGS